MANLFNRTTNDTTSIGKMERVMVLVGTAATTAFLTATILSLPPVKREIKKFAEKSSELLTTLGFPTIPEMEIVRKPINWTEVPSEIMEEAGQ